MSARGLLDHVFVEAHDPQTGKIAVSGLRELFALGTADVAGIAGVTPRAVRQNAGSARVQARFVRFLELMQRVRRLLEGKLPLVRIWLRAPHPDLEMQPPLALLVHGDFERIEGLIRRAEESVIGAS